MNFLEKLDLLMQNKGLNRHTLSQQSGIPYTTIDGWYKKGYQKAKLSTVQKLCDFFSVTLDYLMRDEVVDPQYGKNEMYDKLYFEDKKIPLPKTDPQKDALNRNYDALNTEGRKKLVDYSEDLAGNDKYANKIQAVAYGGGVHWETPKASDEELDKLAEEAEIRALLDDDD